MAEINWPANLPCVLMDGFTYRRQDIVARTQLDSGRARMRQRQADGPTECVGHVVMTGVQFSYFESWFLHRINAGTKPFNLNLTSGSGYQLHEVRFLAPYTMTQVIKAGLFRVSVRLEIRELQVYPESIIDIIDQYVDEGEAFDEFYAFLDIFEIYVNVDLPGSEMAPGGLG